MCSIFCSILLYISLQCVTGLFIVVVVVVVVVAATECLLITGLIRDSQHGMRVNYWMKSDMMSYQTNCVDFFNYCLNSAQSWTYRAVQNVQPTNRKHQHILYVIVAVVITVALCWT